MQLKLCFVLFGLLYIAQSDASCSRGTIDVGTRITTLLKPTCESSIRKVAVELDIIFDLVLSKVGRDFTQFIQIKEQFGRYLYVCVGEINSLNITTEYVLLQNLIKTYKSTTGVSKCTYSTKHTTLQGILKTGTLARLLSSVGSLLVNLIGTVGHLLYDLLSLLGLNPLAQIFKYVIYLVNALIIQLFGYCDDIVITRLKGVYGTTSCTVPYSSTSLIVPQCGQIEAVILKIVKIISIQIDVVLNCLLSKKIAVNKCKNYQQIYNLCKTY